MKLVGYRSAGGFVNPPTAKTVPTWRVGFTWTYEGDEGLTWTTRVVEAHDGIVTVEDTRDQAGSKVTDVRRFRTSDMRNVNFTLLGARFEMSPIGHPLVPPDGERVYPYTKTVTAARGPLSFAGNATIKSQGGAVLVVPGGTFDVRRIDIKEVERDAQGRPNTLEYLRYYADEAGNDVQFDDFDDRTWSLTSYSFGPPPFRFDTLPPP